MVGGSLKTRGGGEAWGPLRKGAKDGPLRLQPGVWSGACADGGKGAPLGAHQPHGVQEGRGQWAEETRAVRVGGQRAPSIRVRSPAHRCRRLFLGCPGGCAQEPDLLAEVVQEPSPDSTDPMDVASQAWHPLSVNPGTCPCCLASWLWPVSSVFRLVTGSRRLSTRTGVNPACCLPLSQWEKEGRLGL